MRHLNLTKLHPGGLDLYAHGGAGRYDVMIVAGFPQGPPVRLLGRVVRDGSRWRAFWGRDDDAVEVYEHTFGKPTHSPITTMRAAVIALGDEYLRRRDLVA